MVLTIIVFAIIFGYLIYTDHLYFKGRRYKYSVVMTIPDGKGYLDNDMMRKYVVYANSINDANIKALEEKLKNQKLDEAKHLSEMKELKKLIDSKTIEIAVKVGGNGKLFGSVSTKELALEYKNQTGIEIDKRKLELNTNIDALGLYKIPIQLHKEVTAYINVKVVEGK